MPKAITVYCRKWSGVTKDEISEAREVKGTCQYPFNRSNFAMNKHGELQGLRLGLAKPFDNRYSGSFLMTSLFAIGQR